MSSEVGNAQRIPRVEIVIVEELDARSVTRLSALLDEALALNPTELVLDLAACPYVDAAAISLLLDGHRRARREGGVLTLRSASPRLRRNLQLARVDGVLQVMSPDEVEPPAGQDAWRATA